MPETTKLEKVESRFEWKSTIHRPWAFNCDVVLPGMSKSCPPPSSSNLGTQEDALCGPVSTCTPFLRRQEWRDQMS